LAGTKKPDYFERLSATRPDDDLQMKKACRANASLLLCEDKIEGGVLLIWGL
jgi:hypothetical protein